MFICLSCTLRRWQLHCTGLLLHNSPQNRNRFLRTLPPNRPSVPERIQTAPTVPPPCRLTFPAPLSEPRKRTDSNFTTSLALCKAAHAYDFTANLPVFVQWLFVGWMFDHDRDEPDSGSFAAQQCGIISFRGGSGYSAAVDSSRDDQTVCDDRRGIDSDETGACAQKPVGNSGSDSRGPGIGALPVQIRLRICEHSHSQGGQQVIRAVSAASLHARPGEVGSRQRVTIGGNSAG